MLGSYVATQAVEAGWETWATYADHPIELPGCRMVQLDIRDSTKVGEVVAGIGPDAIIHTAALVKPDVCEQNKADAFGINVLGTHNLLVAAAKVGAHFVHVSTDLVFSGEHNPIKENAFLNPPNYYGLTKAAAETAIYASNTSWAIARTSIIYGPCKFPFLESFSDKVIESLRAGKPIGGFVDQYRPAIPAWNLADVLLELAQRRLTGIYHAVCPEPITRNQFARRIAQVFGYDESLITPLYMDETKAAAYRPKMLVLDVVNTSRVLNTRLLTFEEGIQELRARMVDA